MDGPEAGSQKREAQGLQLGSGEVAAKPTPTFSFSAVAPTTTNSTSIATGEVVPKPKPTPTFSFSAVAPTNTADSTSGVTAGDEDEEYVPPKVENVEIEEKDAFYQIKCKLFYKKEEKFVGKGIGTLYLKRIDNSTKTQLLIRAGTSLGNILLNIQLDPAIPCARVGKNNISLVCVANPPLEAASDEQSAMPTEPTSLLIRVKTGEAAHTLCQQIEAASKSERVAAKD